MQTRVVPLSTGLGSWGVSVRGSARFCAMLGLLFIGAALPDDTVLSSVRHGDCVATIELERSTMVIRAKEGCKLSQHALERLLDAGLSALPKPRQGTTYRSIFLGRLVRYPWMVAQLIAAAAESNEWDGTRGRAKDRKDNALVARLLFESGAVAPAAQVVARHGYVVTDVSVEKVLVATREQLPDDFPPESKGKLPFDAQVWLEIRKR